MRTGSSASVAAMCCESQAAPGTAAAIARSNGLARRLQPLLLTCDDVVLDLTSSVAASAGAALAAGAAATLGTRVALRLWTMAKYRDRAKTPSTKYKQILPAVLDTNTACISGTLYST